MSEIILELDKYEIEMIESLNSLKDELVALDNGVEYEEIRGCDTDNNRYAKYIHKMVEEEYLSAVRFIFNYFLSKEDIMRSIKCSNKEEIIINIDCPNELFPGQDSFNEYWMRGFFGSFFDEIIAFCIDLQSYQVKCNYRNCNQVFNEIDYMDIYKYNLNNMDFIKDDYLNEELELDFVKVAAKISDIKKEFINKQEYNGWIKMFSFDELLMDLLYYVK